MGIKLEGKTVEEKQKGQELKTQEKTKVVKEKDKVAQTYNHNIKTKLFIGLIKIVG